MIGMPRTKSENDLLKYTKQGIRNPFRPRDPHNLENRGLITVTSISEFPEREVRLFRVPLELRSELRIPSYHR